MSEAIKETRAQLNDIIKGLRAAVVTMKKGGK